MTRQSSTPFMKLNDKKGKKAVSFDARDVLERNSRNMERMTVLMNKMYIKLDQTDVLYKPQIYERRGRGQNRQNFKQNNNNWRRNRSFSRERNYSGNRGYYVAGDISEEVVFKEGTVVILEETIIGIEIEKIGGLGHGQDQEKEE